MRIDFIGAAIAAAVVVVEATALNATEMPPPMRALGHPPPAGAGSIAGSGVPSGRVGQVSLVSGKVEYRGPGEAQWSAAFLNDPVAAGVALRTDPAARAEIRIGADTIDLAEGTEIVFVRLDWPIAEVAVNAGRIELEVRRLAAGESVQIDIPHGGAWLLGAGRYDIDAGTGGHRSRIAAFAGDARFVGNGADLPIAAGYRLLVDPSGPVASVIETASGDEFVNWCTRRAVDDTALATPYFVSRDITGYAALDAAGDWVASNQYGEVWVPRAPAGEWAPYRNGHWRWFAPWGWSWIDDQPWGFAVSHYGRWKIIGGHWSWVPGRPIAHPVWVPAVVGFLGTPGVGLSYADGPGPAIAWFPLGPGEIYWPNYSHDLDYIRALNRGNVADLDAIRQRADGEPSAEIVNAHFANREFASVVPRPVFVSGQPVAAALLSLPDQRLRNAPTLMGSPEIGPPPAAPVRLAASPARDHSGPPPGAKVEKGWTALLHAALVRSRNFQEAARQRFAHLRIAAAAEIGRLGHAVVLRVARADHAAVLPDKHRRMIRR
jgi:hypothetical protein